MHLGHRDQVQEGGEAAVRDHARRVLRDGGHPDLCREPGDNVQEGVCRGMLGRK